MPTKEAPDKRDAKARDYADTIPDDEASDTDYVSTACACHKTAV